MTITPEMIKVVAEGMKLSPYINTEGEVFLGSPMFGGARYNPLEIPKQDSEIEIKLGVSTSFIREGLWQADTGPIGNNCGRGNTPAEARFMAAYNYFSEVK